MKKLVVDEIISGLINTYEELLIVAADPEHSPAKWHYLTGKVTALRWVLGQDGVCALDGMAPVVSDLDEQLEDILEIDDDGCDPSYIAAKKEAEEFEKKLDETKE